MTADLPFLTPLTEAQQLGFGLPTPATLALADRVRFSEIDPLNHVNNVAYLIWFESLRVAYFQHIGLTTYAAPEAEPRIVIRRGEMDWLAEMRAHDAYVATCQCVAYRKTSFTLDQGVWVGNRLCARLQSVIVLLHPDGSGRMPIPKQTLRYFHEREGAVAAESLGPGR